VASRGPVSGSGGGLAGSQTSLTYAYASSATIRIATSDLNNTAGFNLGLIAVSGVTFDASGNPNFDNIDRDLLTAVTRDR
jgi:hypothetical protein